MANVFSRRFKKVEKNFSPMEEGLMVYSFYHKLMDNLSTLDGDKIEVLDAGLRNRNPGPDFFNAKLRIGGVLWVGNVLILPRSSEWYARGYNASANSLFGNIILTVVNEHDADIFDADGHPISQCLAQVPDHIIRNYNTLISENGDAACKCYRDENITRLHAHAWMSAVTTEWLERASESMKNSAMNTSWQNALVSAITSDTVITNVAKAFMDSIVKAESVDQTRLEIKNFLSMVHLPNSQNNVERILVNIILPWMFAYGRYTHHEVLCDHAFDFSENTKPYSTKADAFGWPYRQKLSGIEISTISYLKENYCSKKNCCSCRFGHEFLRNNKSREKNLQLSMLF